MGRIEDVLIDEQRSSYREILGKPFDLTKLLVRGHATEG